MQIVRVPLLNANEDEVTLVDVRVQEGAEVRAGDVLLRRGIHQSGSGRRSALPGLRSQSARRKRTAGSS